MGISSYWLRSLTDHLSWQRRTGKATLLVGGLIIASAAAFLIYSSFVSAATTTIIPNGDVTSTGWSGTGTNDGNSCTAGTLCDFIDEPKGSPVTADYLATTADTAGEWALNSFTFPAGVTATDSVTIGAYVNTITVNGGGSPNADEVILYLISGTTVLATGTPQTPLNGSYGWITSTFTGSWSQAQIDDARIRVGFNRLGTGSAAAKRDVIHFATMYADVNYTTPVTYNQSSYRWFDNSGTPLATQNTTATAPAQGTPFRLRFLLTAGAYDMTLSSQSFKLQVATKSGTCAASSYTDLTTNSGDIRLYDNAGVSDGSVISGTANDPTYLSSTKRVQTYFETNTFTNSNLAVAVGESGLWEASLVNAAGLTGSTYCFRVVKSNNGTLDTYTQYPEITAGPEPDSGRQFYSDHTTSIDVGSTIVSSTSSLMLDFTTLGGSTTQTLTPEVEIRSTASSFTGTATHSSAPISSTFTMPNLRMQSCSAYDPVGKRMIVFGGQGATTATHYNDTWAVNLPKDAPATYQLLTANGAGGSPAIRRGCVMTYDSTANRMILFGGRITGGTTIVYNDVWALSLGTTPAWSQLSPTGTPPGTRTVSNMIYDVTGNQIILFGGYNGSSFLNDTWRLTLGGTPAWTQLSPTGGPPAIRAGHAFELDPITRLVWLTGGTASTDYNDLWKYDIANNTWTQIYANNCTPNCPHPVEGPVMVYDSLNQQMVLTGGHNWGTNAGFASGMIRTTYILSNLGGTPTWSTPSITSALPHGRYYGNAEYDVQNQRMVVFVGQNYPLGSNGINKDFSALYLPSGGATPYWRSVAVNYGWSGRDQSAPYYDSTNKRLYLYGGFANGTLPQTDTTGTHVPDTFRLDLTNGRAPRWRNVNPQSQQGSAAPPIAREAVAFATDTSRNRLIVFGGLHETHTLNDTWVMTPPTTGGEPVWTQLCTATSCGTAPTARWLAYAVYDSIGDRFIVFGGEQESGTDLNDTWALSLSGTPTWTQLSPGGSVPSIRFGGAAVFDSPNNRMVIFGGQNDGGAQTNSYNTTHALSLGASPSWSTIVATGQIPAARRSMGYTLANISGSNKMVIFGGYTIGSTTHYNDVAVLDLTTGVWSTSYTSNCSDGNAPACRRSTIAVYESSDNSIIVSTGRDASQFFADTFRYNLTNNTWTNLNPINEYRFSVPVSGLTDGSYHWQYRVTGSSSGAQSYRSFSNNSDTPTAGTDFTFCNPPTVDNRMRLDTFFCVQTKQNKFL